MYCNNCGSHIKDSDKFCNNCGKPISKQQNLTVKKEKLTDKKIEINDPKAIKIALIIGFFAVFIFSTVKLFTLIYFFEAWIYSLLYLPLSLSSLAEVVLIAKNRLKEKEAVILTAISMASIFEIILRKWAFDYIGTTAFCIITIIFTVISALTVSFVIMYICLGKTKLLYASLFSIVVNIISYCVLDYYAQNHPLIDAVSESSSINNIFPIVVYILIAIQMISLLKKPINPLFSYNQETE